MEEFVKEERFSGGLVCPICGCIQVARNGHRKDGAQRYICRDCGKTFVAISNSIVKSQGTVLIDLFQSTRTVPADLYPSSKTCHKCGHINKDLKLSDRAYICPECGNIIDRDWQAALNILDEGHRSSSGRLFCADRSGT